MGSRLQRSLESLSPQNREAVGGFVTSLRAGGLKESTLEKAAQWLLDFDRVLAKPLESLQREDILLWLSATQGRLAPYIASKRLVTLARFLAWRRGSAPEFLRELKLRPKASPRGFPPPPKDIVAVSRGCTCIRDLALLMVAVDTAMRPMEITSLRCGDVEVDERGAMLRVAGKNGARAVRLTESLAYLLLWLEHHPRREPDAPLWITAHGGGVTPQRFLRILKLASKRTGAKGLHPYTIRHARLTQLAQELTEHELKQVAGWRPSSRMARVYVHLSGQDVGDKMARLSGLAAGILPCVRCFYLNPAVAARCLRCGVPLSVRDLSLLAQQRAEVG